eukprot:scaffold14515_cov117-Isochrysis_galbana.AAC.4
MLPPIVSLLARRAGNTASQQCPPGQQHAARTHTHSAGQKEKPRLPTPTDASRRLRLRGARSGHTDTSPPQPQCLFAPMLTITILRLELYLASWKSSGCAVGAGSLSASASPRPGEGAWPCTHGRAQAQHAADRAMARRQAPSMGSCVRLKPVRRQSCEAPGPKGSTGTKGQKGGLAKGKRREARGIGAYEKDEGCASRPASRNARPSRTSRTRRAMLVW